MDKRGRIILSVAIILVVLIGIFSLYFVLAAGENWTIDGNKVYIDDSKVYISASPHTIQESGYVYFDVISKVYNGNADLVFGFDTDKLKPVKAEIYEPYKVTYSNEICTHNNQTNETSCNIISYTQLEEWKDISDSFNSINYDYSGMNKWWYIKDVPITSNTNYKFRVLMNIERKDGFSPEKLDVKYWFAIKPSSETISQSINNNHIYALDPWVNSTGQDQNKDYLNDSLMAFWNFDIDGNDTTGYGINCTGNAVHYSSTGTGGGFYDFNDGQSLNCSYSGRLKVYRNMTLMVVVNATQGVDDQIVRMGVSPFPYAFTGWNGKIDYRVYNGDIPNQLTSTGSISTSTPTQFIMTFNDTGSWILYYNGAVDTFTSKGNSVIPYNIGDNLRFGERTDGTGDIEDGAIFMAAVWNRSLNSSEVVDLYNSGTFLTYSPAVSDTIAPNTTTPIITPPSPKTNDNLQCNATLIDNLQTTLTAYWKWYKNNVSYLSGNTPVTNGIDSLITTLNSGNTTKGESWICEIKPFDGTNYGEAKNSSSVTILNSVPTHINPLLSTPSGKNFSYENLTCYNQSTSDTDNDIVTNIYNWYKNSQPLVILNLPFEINADDYSGNNNDGAINGATFTGGKVGKALIFDGVDDTVSVDLTNFPNTAFTFEMWFNVKEFASNGRDLFTKYSANDGFRTLITSSGQLESAWDIGDTFKTLTATDIITNTWYHFVVVYNSSLLSLYLNGDLKDSEIASGNLTTGINTLTLGFNDLATPNFNGTIDEVKIYPYALTQEQIKQRYEETKDGLTSNSKIVAEETTAGDNYMCQVTPNDAEEDGITLNSSVAEIKWAITFDIRDSYSNASLNGVNIGCNSTDFSQEGDTTNTYGPYGFKPGMYSCTFAEATHYNKTIVFAADNDTIINVKLSKELSLTVEEHTWLEAIYNCLYSGDCSLYNLLLEVNQTVGKVWEHTKSTDNSVITFENITNKVVDSTHNLTIDYTINIPIKTGYATGTYLPVRIGYWFLNNANTTCYNQGDKPTGVEEPYCQPLIIETIGPMGGSVNFTVKLQPSLPAGNYSIKRIIDIDPNNIWINYGQELISTFIMADSLSTYGISIEKTGENNPGINNQQTSTSQESSSSSGGNSKTTNIYNIYNVTNVVQENKRKENDEENISKSTGITGGVIGTIGNLLSGWQITFIITALCITFIIFILIKYSIIKIKR